jgi:hypothetical protein
MMIMNCLITIITTTIILQLFLHLYFVYKIIIQVVIVINDCFITIITMMLCDVLRVVRDCVRVCVCVM